MLIDSTRKRFGSGHGDGIPASPLPCLDRRQKIEDDLVKQVRFFKINGVPALRKNRQP